MNVLITFSGAPYDATTKLIVERAPLCGSDAVWVYDDKWLAQQDFYKLNPWLWEHPHKRGFGWYAWKPFIIWHALSRLHEGDLVLYIDADTVPIANHRMLYQRCEQDGGILLFASENHHQHEWCKRDCYVVMGQDDESSLVMPAGVARFMVFQKGRWEPTQFLMEWLTYCVNPRATTFDPSVLAPDQPGFIEHRAEQAILTNLAHKYGVTLHREACGAGNGASRDWDLYPQLFEQINADVAHESADPVGSAYANVGADHRVFGNLIYHNRGGIWIK